MNQIDIDYTDSLNHGFNKWVEYELEITNQYNNSGGTLALILSGLLYTSANASTSYGIKYRNVKVQVITDSDYSANEEVTVNENNNKNGNSVDLIIGDLPDIEFNKFIFKNGLATSENGDVSIGNWRENASPFVPYGSLKDIIRAQINYNSASPMQILRGSVYGEYKLYNVLEFVNNSNKRYMIAGATWNDKKATLTGEFIELYYVSGGLPTDRLLSNSTEYILSNGTDFIIISG